MAIFGYIASLLMGLSLGMIGGGGSILTVPILVYLFEVNPIPATAYSLFIVGSTAFFGGLLYLKRGEVDLKTGAIFAIPSFIGVYSTRAFVVPHLPDPILAMGSLVLSKPLFIMMIFALLMIFSSYSMLSSKRSELKVFNLNPLAKVSLIAFEGLAVGGVTGLVGAGGGFLIIPALVVLVGLPMRKAIGTSLLIIAVKSLIGFLGDVQHQLFLDWSILLPVTGIALIGLFFGIFFSKKVSEKTLKKGFGYFVLLMGAMILLDQIRRL